MRYCTPEIQMLFAIRTNGVNGETPKYNGNSQHLDSKSVPKAKLSILVKVVNQPFASAFLLNKTYAFDDMVVVMYPFEPIMYGDFVS